MERTIDRIERKHGSQPPWTRLLVLPDNAPLDFARDTDPSAPVRVAIDDKLIGAYRTLPRAVALVISGIGTPFEHTADHVPKYALLEILPPAAVEAHDGQRAPSSITIADLWGILNLLHTLYHTQDTIPIVLSPLLTNSPELTAYLLNSGLARRRHTLTGDPDPTHSPELFLPRETFWQGAGTSPIYHSRGWLRGHAAALAAAPFPNVQSFTRTETVISAHPLRPPKPPPGQVVYRKFFPSMGRMLEFTYIDLGDDEDERTVSPHLETFHRWHNSDHVNRGWGERGPIEKHRAYLRNLMAHPGVLPVMMSWDGELMGYAEFVYIKENHVATFVPGGAWDHDRGLHILVGEKKFRGLERSKPWMAAIHHFLFLSDPRTLRVIGEPKEVNKAVIVLSEAVGMTVNSRFDFPYKRSVMTWLPRERWFKHDVLAYAKEEGEDVSAPAPTAKL